ncbi:MAG: 3'-5' exonuclease [Desulfobulbaceae bacterium]|nr:3'-5' exonuclease [Desulfobulbaceae bacterium]
MQITHLFQKITRPLRPPAHPLIIHNNNLFPPGAKYPQLLSEQEFVVLDTELTGFNRKQDEIVAIGAVRIKNLQILCGETFYALIRPDERFHTKSTLVHRLTPQELRCASPMADVLPRFLHFCGDAFLVGHYVRLDLDFINRATKKLLGGVLQTPYFDTMCLAMAHKNYKNDHASDIINRHDAYTLTALSAEFGLPSFMEHNALQDSMQTAYLFLYLIKKMSQQGLQTMQEYLVAGRNRSMIWWPY